jgi:hypothetical protein
MKAPDLQAPVWPPEMKPHARSPDAAKTLLSATEGLGDFPAGLRDPPERLAVQSRPKTVGGNPFFTVFEFCSPIDVQGNHSFTTYVRRRGGSKHGVVLVYLEAVDECHQVST